PAQAQPHDAGRDDEAQAHRAARCVSGVSGSPGSSRGAPLRGGPPLSSLASLALRAGPQPRLRSLRELALQPGGYLTFATDLAQGGLGRRS
ncbi:MAG TPA: hypothetical protein VJU61_19045, partial [Polyangiaceae bacterium]|nr:hypothetical protein [Polyangiaceae bacterium]